ncbi:MAG: pilus (MSHA type) biogenesis protein MshL [Campylobacter sp.]|nr:pilus (MSHA type) biogenesis protein MshL [Campylobacter sp.]
MLQFHINKKLKIFSMALVLGLCVSSLQANNCDRRALSMQIDNAATINEVLTQLSNVCSFSTVAKDALATQEMERVISGVNIKDKTLNQIFEIILTKNNLNYEFRDNVLTISGLFTKTFKIDYIPSVREASAITRSSVTSRPISIDDAETTEGEKSDNEIVTTENFDFWSTISEEITLVLNNGTENYAAVAPIINRNAGLVTVTATKSQLNRVEKYVNELHNRLQKQVMLDVSIIAVDLHNTYTTGIDWSKFELGFNTYLNGNPDTPSRFSFGNRYETPLVSQAAQYQDFKIGKDAQGNDITITRMTMPERYEWGNIMSTKASDALGTWAIGANLNFNINGMINFLETKGKTKVISSPKIVTLHNQPALISVGTNLNYLLLESQKTGTGTDTTTDIDTEQYTSFVGILLNILPQISDDGKIMLRVNPSISELVNEEDKYIPKGAARNVAPDTYEKKLSTVAYVNDGDTVIIGGLISQKNGKNNTNVPVLSSIPLLGKLFKSSEDILSVTELVFVITPRLVNAPKPMSESLKELGYSKSTYEEY